MSDATLAQAPTVDEFLTAAARLLKENPVEAERLLNGQSRTMSPIAAEEDRHLTLLDRDEVVGELAWIIELDPELSAKLAPVAQPTPSTSPAPTSPAAPTSPTSPAVTDDERWARQRRADREARAAMAGSYKAMALARGVNPADVAKQAAAMAEGRQLDGGQGQGFGFGQGQAPDSIPPAEGGSFVAAATATAAPATAIEPINNKSASRHFYCSQPAVRAAVMEAAGLTELGWSICSEVAFLIESKGHCRIGHDILAERFRVKRNAVKVAIRAAVKQKLFSVIDGGGRNCVNTYVFGSWVESGDFDTAVVAMQAVIDQSIQQLIEPGQRKASVPVDQKGDSDGSCIQASESKGDSDGPLFQGNEPKGCADESPFWPKGDSDGSPIEKDLEDKEGVGRSFNSNSNSLSTTKEEPMSIVEATQSEPDDSGTVEPKGEVKALPAWIDKAVELRDKYDGAAPSVIVNHLYAAGFRGISGSIIKEALKQYDDQQNPV